MHKLAIESSMKPKEICEISHASLPLARPAPFLATTRLEMVYKLSTRSAKSEFEIGHTPGGTNPLASLAKCAMNDPN